MSLMILVMTDVATMNSLCLVVEVNMSVVAACLPTLGGFLKGRIQSHSSKAHSSDSNVKSPPRSWGNKIHHNTSPSLQVDRRDDWIPLRDASYNTTVVNDSTEGAKSHNIDSKSIMVEKSFSSERMPA